MAHLKNHVGKVRKKMKDYDSKRIYLWRGSKTGSETTRPSVRTYSGAFFPSPPPLSLCPPPPSPSPPTRAPCLCLFRPAMGFLGPVPPGPGPCSLPPPPDLFLWPRTIYMCSPSERRRKEKAEKLEVEQALTFILVFLYKVVLDAPPNSAIIQEG